MGTMRKALLTIAMLGIVSMAIATVYLWLATSHFSFREMDWNSDGETSLRELADAIDLDVRDVAKDGLNCREYYSLKDGRAVHLRCAEQLPQR